MSHLIHFHKPKWSMAQVVAERSDGHTKVILPREGPWLFLLNCIQKL